MSDEKPLEPLMALVMGADHITANGVKGMRTGQKTGTVEITEQGGHS